MRGFPEAEVFLRQVHGWIPEPNLGLNPTLRTSCALQVPRSAHAKAAGAVLLPGGLPCRGRVGATHFKMRLAGGVVLVAQQLGQRAAAQAESAAALCTGRGSGRGLGDDT